MLNSLEIKNNSENRTIQPKIEIENGNLRFLKVGKSSKNCSIEVSILPLNGLKILD